MQLLFCENISKHKFFWFNHLYVQIFQVISTLGANSFQVQIFLRSFMYKCNYFLVQILFWHKFFFGANYFFVQIHFLCKFFFVQIHFFYANSFFCAKSFFVQILFLCNFGATSCFGAIIFKCNPFKVQFLVQFSSMSRF